MAHAGEWPAYREPKTDADVPAWNAILKFRSSYGACVTEAAAVVPSTQECIANEYHYQDQRLNAVYKQLMTTLGPDQQKTLRLEERRWITYRNGRCDSLQPQLEPESCRLNATADRATQLETRLTAK
jgi:uncharacterized protein YecT (DUF1311 family)